MKLTWTGGDANSAVAIQGSAGGNSITVNGVSTPSNVSSGFVCFAPASAGSFTIPPSVLQALAVASGGGTNGSISVQLLMYPQTLTLPIGDSSFAFGVTAPVSVNVAFQ